VKDKVGAWSLIVVAMVIGYVFSYFNTRQNMPAVAAQIGANQQLIGQVNQAFSEREKQLDTRFTQIETRVKTLETKD